MVLDMVTLRVFTAICLGSGDEPNQALANASHALDAVKQSEKGFGLELPDE